MFGEGPPLEALTGRLARTPSDFLDEPRIGNAGRVRVDAVVNDLIRDLGGKVTAEQLAQFVSQDAQADRNRLAIALITAWLLADEWFRQQRIGVRAIDMLGDGARELAGLVQASKFAADADRREELVRIALARLGLRPAGETDEQAQDRLTTISTAERQRVVAAARAAEERARQIREALARKAAEESADKWSRE